MARLEQPTLELVHALQNERDLTAGYVAARRESGGEAVRRQRASADRLITAYQQAAAGVEAPSGTPLHSRLEAATDDLDGLRQLRDAVNASGLLQSSIQAQYTDIIASLLSLGSGLATERGAQALARDTSSLDRISQATEYASQTRAELHAVFTSDTFLVGQFPAFAGAAARHNQTVEEFLATASPSQQAVYANTVKGSAITRTKTFEDRASELAGASRLNLKPDDWYRTSSRKLLLLQAVESRVLDDLISHSQDLQSRQQRAALLAAAALLIMLALAAATSLTVVRSLTRPLQRLRLSAMEIADQRLPEAVKRLRGAKVDNLGDLEPVPINASAPDEIGEVARAVDALQQAALGLAKDQAALRHSINGMFVNLSLRSQQLGSRLLALVEALEENEVNPDQLENLFAIDHLVTRMLRNSEGLLVLAGAQNQRARNQRLTIAETLMAATSEVEHYTRIVIADFPQMTIAPGAAIDVVHLLAELMENATVFSGPKSTVTVSWHPSPGPVGLCIEIVDRGMGMDAQQIEVVNQRLANPPTIDASTVGTMGLFVVSQLAARHGIRVWLTGPLRGGVKATVMLPLALLVGVSAEDLSPGPGDDPRRQRLQAPPETDARPEPRPAAVASVDADDSVPAPAFGSMEEWRQHRRLFENMAITEPDEMR